MRERGAGSGRRGVYVQRTVLVQAKRSETMPVRLAAMLFPAPSAFPTRVVAAIPIPSGIM